MDPRAIVQQALNGRSSKYPLSAQTVPLEVALRSKTDPAMGWPGAPPNWGQPDMPHIFSFVGRYGMVANSYMHADEALIHSAQNAEIMRNEPMIMECIEARMRCVSLLNWHIQPVDNDILRDALDKTDSQETAMSIRRALKKPKSDAEKMAEQLTSILKHTPHFMKFRYSLMEAIWYGKAASAQTMGVRVIGGQRRIFIRKWEPRHGDKLIFRYADESYEYDPDQLGIRIGPTTHGHDAKWVDYAGFERNRIDPTQHGLVYWFDGQQRRRMCVHKHIIEDGDFMRPEKAGAINGVGIRSRIYWTWWAYQECLKLLLEYVERSALGIEIWKYPAHDPKAKERTEKAAQERGAPGRSVMLVPVPTGEYGDMYGVQIVEPGLGGINELQSVLQTFFGHKIKRYILGQTLTSEAEATGMGSGVADAHLATFHDIIRFDGLNLEETLTTDLVRPLQQWNFPGTDDIYLRFVIDTESPDAQERIAGYQAAWSMGLKIRTEDMYDALGAAPPQDGEEFLDNPGLESARIGIESQKMQMQQMQMQAQMQMQQAQPQTFAPFPEMGSEGVPGDADGDGLANDEQSQLYQRRAKVDRYALKKNGVGRERYAAEPIKQNLSDEHHSVLGNALKEAEKKKGIPFHSPSFYAKRGFDPNQELTHDDQHLILLHAGYLSHPQVGKKLFGNNYDSSGGTQVPNQPLGRFMADANKALRDHGTEAIRENASQRISGAKVVSFKNQSGGRLVLHPAVRKDATSGWQLTSMSGHDGRPNGHYNPKSFDHGWQNALGVGEDGYWNEHGYEVEWTDKDGTKAPFSVSGDYWLEVERFGRYKPMAGQREFNWDEEQHPRESEEHDGKRPGEFAPKEQAEAAGEPDSKPKTGGKGKDGWQLVATEFGDELKIKRGADFATDGSYDVEYDGRRGQISRDPENGHWYVNGSGHFADRFIATSKNEAISYIANEGKRWTDHSKPFESEPAIKPEVDSDRQKLLDEARAARKWTNNGDGTYTAPNGVVWRRAQQDGEISPVTGKPFRKNEFMPIHGLAADKPKPEPKPKRESLAGANTKEWKEPKVRQYSESEIAERRERQEEQRRWDALRSTPLANVYWLGDAPTFANWKVKKGEGMLDYLSKLRPEQVQSLGQQLRAKLIEREVNQYFQPGENERLLQGENITRAELAKRIAEDFDYHSDIDAGYILTSKVRKQSPGIEAAVWGLKSWFDKRLPVEHAEELAAILPKPGTVDRLSAEDWAEIERYARLKPMAGQLALDWDESEHPRETEAHDDKKAGEFAPKSSQDGIKVPARLASPTRKGEITEDQAKTMKVRGTTEAVTECDYCGKHSLRKTVVFELTDADGNGNGEFRHLGVDCAARLTGRKPERIAREAAERDYEANRKQEMHDRDKPKRISDNLDDANKAFNQTGRHRGVHEIAGLTELRWNDAGKVVRVDTTDPDDVAWYEKNGFVKREQPSGTTTNSTAPAVPSAITKYPKTIKNEEGRDVDRPPIYLSGSHSNEIASVAEEIGNLGLLVTPATKSHAKHLGKYQFFGVDNGCFSGQGNFNEAAFYRLLSEIKAAGHADKSLFAAAPDVFDPVKGEGDWPATLKRSLPHLDRIRKAGFPAAIVLQDGATAETVPWDKIDALFVGGSTGFKLGGYKDAPAKTNPDFVKIVREAKRRGIPFHYGRVNSDTRLEAVHFGLGADSVDGNFIKFAPGENLQKVKKWLRPWGKFPAQPSNENQPSSHIPVHPDILDEWRSSERWAYDNAEDWAHANDADPADFDKWVNLRDKVQSASETVSPDLQFHLWDWLNEQADGDIPAGWKQAEKQLGVQLGIYRPWSDDDAKEVEFTTRGQRASKPLFRHDGKSFALNDKRLQELQTQRYGQMFFEFDEPSKKPAPAAKPADSSDDDIVVPPDNPFAAKFANYLRLQQKAAQQGLDRKRKGLLD